MSAASAADLKRFGDADLITALLHVCMSTLHIGSDCFFITPLPCPVCACPAALRYHYLPQPAERSPLSMKSRADWVQ